MRRRLRRIKDAPLRALIGSKPWRAAVAVILVGTCAGLLITVVVRSYQVFNFTGPHRTVYEGRIVDRSMTITESQLGSGAVYLLHVRGRDGVVFDKVVTAELYGRARVGMWVRGGPNGPELYATEPPQVVGATKTEGAETPSVSAPR
jgi:hypothetical protein